MRTAVIKADHVAMLLVCMKIAARQRARGNQWCRWAAMSDHVSTNDCTRRLGPGYRLPHGPLLAPMQAGRIDRAIERIRMMDGTRGVGKVFGKGIRALRAETESAVMR